MIKPNTLKPMGRQGQSNISGVSDQIDASIYYFLNNLNNSSFKEIILEDNKWEDFNLIFSDKKIVCESRSWDRKLSYSEVKEILVGINKKIQSLGFSDKDRLLIICRQLGESFSECVKYLESSWINKESFEYYKKSRFIRTLLGKKFDEDLILLLKRCSFFEFKNSQFLEAQIYGFLQYEIPLYLTENYDIPNTAKILFAEFVKKAKIGAKFTKIDLQKIIDDRKTDILKTADKRYSSISKVVALINNYFTRNNIGKLSAPEEIRIISTNPRVVLYLIDRIGQAGIKLDKFDLILNALLKRHYVYSIHRLLESKLKSDSSLTEFIFRFLTQNIKYFKIESLSDWVLDTVLATVKYNNNLILEAWGFVKEELRNYPIENKNKRFNNRELIKLSEIIKVAYNALPQSRTEIIDFIFSKFDFSWDDFPEVFETPLDIYGIVRDYLETNFIANFDNVLSSIVAQFQKKYGNKFKGYEWIGSSISQAGNSYSITDKAVVRLIFQPALLNYYKQFGEVKGFDFIKSKILSIKTSVSNPIFLKRAIVPILIKRLKENTNPKETISYLIETVKEKEGIPNTSEIVFNILRNIDFCNKEINQEYVLDIIKADIKKYGKNLPSNIFVVITILNLIKAGNENAKSLFMKLLNNSEYFKYDDRNYNTLEQIHIIYESQLEFAEKIVKKYFEQLEFSLTDDAYDTWYDKGRPVKHLIEQQWSQGKDSYILKIYKTILSRDTVAPAMQKFICLSFPDLYLKDKNRFNIEIWQWLFKLIKSDYRNYKLNKKFQHFNNEYAREFFVELVENFINEKDFCKAKQLIDILINDPDPGICNKPDDPEGKFNYHEKIKNGEQESLITGVKGRLCWAIQKLIKNWKEDHDYIFEKTKILLNDQSYYVKMQAMVPLIEIAHPGRRKELPRIGNEIKNYVISLLDNNDIINNKPLMEMLLRVFSYVRDISEKEAKKLLNICKKLNLADSCFLFLYFAIFRKEQYDKNFNDNEFKVMLIKELEDKKSEIKSSVACEFWRMLEKDFNIYPKIKDYFELIIDNYPEDDRDFIFMSLKIIVLNDFNNNYTLLKKAIKNSFSVVDSKEPVWCSYKEVFQILLERDKNKFIECFSIFMNEFRNKKDVWISDFPALLQMLSRIPPQDEALKRKIAGWFRFSSDLYPDLSEYKKTWMELVATKSAS